MVRTSSVQPTGSVRTASMARFPFLRPASGTRPRRADSLDVVAEPMLRRLADYWLSRRAGQVMPRRADIDPVDIPWALSQLFLVDCISDAGRGADGDRKSTRLNSSH